MTENQLLALLDSLCALPQETEWVEFKENNEDPEEIGEYLSALSNSARLSDKDAGYLVWGVADGTHELVGTSFRPHRKKKGNQQLESWLANLLNPHINFQFHTLLHEEKAVVILEIQPCQSTPTRWKGTAFVRVGSDKKRLSEYVEKERLLWSLLSQSQYEKEVAASDLSVEDVLRLLDFSAYYDLTKQVLPKETRGIVEHLIQEKMVMRRTDGRLDITNFGAILFAKKLTDFDRLGRKAVRVIEYAGNNRVASGREYKSDSGYANGFEALVAYINSRLPANEHIGKAFRVDARMYPEIAVRELVANTIIHQDFSLVGDSPLVEIFTDRVEFTNGGKPLIEPLRFADEPPQSRNERLAGFLHRIHVCEERGSGVDKTLTAVELYQLPAPEFRVTQNHTVASLFSHKDFKEMSTQERVWACYWHTVLMYVSHQQMTNTTLRRRFSIEDSNYPAASKVIQDALRDGVIKPYDAENQSRRHARYIPNWA